MAVGKSSINRVAKSADTKTTKTAAVKKSTTKSAETKKSVVKKTPAKKAVPKRSVIASPAIEVGVKQEFHGVGKELPTFLL